MKTSKIAEIISTKKWEGPNMTIYYITVKLENGETITLGKRKEDSLMVGQSITYTEEDKDGKKKWKEVRQFGSKSSGGMNNRQVAALGACIIASQGKVKFEEAVESILKWLEA